jgi:hypothetical protein
MMEGIEYSRTFKHEKYIITSSTGLRKERPPLPLDSHNQQYNLHNTLTPFTLYPPFFSLNSCVIE